MSKTETEKQSSSVGFIGLLTILFIALKLIGVISWSWLWVLSPLWIPPVVFIILTLVGLIITGVN